MANEIVSASRNELNPQLIASVQHPLFTDFVTMELSARFPALDLSDLHAAVVNALERAAADLAVDLANPEGPGGSREAAA